MASSLSRQSILQRGRSITALLVAGSDRTRSILPFLPRSVRWILLFVLLLNYRALPMIWHLRVFRSIVEVRTRGLFKWFDHMKRRAFIKEISPIGENPFDFTVTYRTTCDLSDSDYNGHLSNSAYAKNLDYARMRAAVTCFPSVLEAKGWLGLGTAHFHYIKEIPLWSEYEIRINIAGWGDKWLNLVVQFVTYPKGRKARAGPPFTVEHTKAGMPADELPSTTPLPNEAVVSELLEPWRPSLPPFLPSANAVVPDNDEPPRGRSPTPRSRSRSTSMSSVSSTSSYITSPDEARDDSGSEASPHSRTSTTPSSLAPDTPPIISPSKASRPLPSSLPGTHHVTQPSTPQTQSSGEVPDRLVSAMPPLPEGAVLHCVHVSSYCFKIGRITIPPRVAIIASGFGDKNKGRWERVQEIRNTRSEPGDSPKKGGGEVGGLRGILRGGWKKYEQEGLWDLPEYEEARIRGVEAFGALREQMDALRA